MNILTVNLLFSTLVFWIIARVYVLPRLGELRPRTVLLPVLILNAFRHLGLMFLAPGATYPGIPARFAYPAAFGDLLAALLAVAAIPAVATGSRAARTLVWVFNLEGSIDLIDAIVLATVYPAAPYMGGLLDTRLLGARAPRLALRDVRGSPQALARRRETVTMSRNSERHRGVVSPAAATSTNRFDPRPAETSRDWQC